MYLFILIKAIKTYTLIKTEIREIEHKNLLCRAAVAAWAFRHGTQTLYGAPFSEVLASFLRASTSAANYALKFKRTSTTKSFI